MFTGIIEQLSVITEVTPSPGGAMRLGLARPHGIKVEHGDSIAVDGCCLTVAEFDAETLRFDVSSETLMRTIATAYQPGITVNIEPALAIGGRLGGHLVTGHVDSLGEISVVEANPGGWVVGVQFGRENAGLVIPKGSITINGISLTINTISDLQSVCEIRVMLIPTTLQKTTLARARKGQRVNLEFDMVGKYILRQKEVRATDTEQPASTQS